LRRIWPNTFGPATEGAPMLVMQAQISIEVGSTAVTGPYDGAVRCLHRSKKQTNFPNDSSYIELARYVIFVAVIMTVFETFRAFVIAFTRGRKMVGENRLLRADFKKTRLKRGHRKRCRRGTDETEAATVQRSLAGGSQQNRTLRAHRVHRSLHERFLRLRHRRRSA